MSIRNLGQATNVDVIREFVSLEGKRVVDAGCGNLTFTKLLVELGAMALAVDPDPVQAAKNQANPVTGIEFIQSGADQIPADDNSVDGVFFSYSLHHIPAELYPTVFSEVFRVLRPDGFLYVIEPIGGAANDVMKLFHDEDRERTVAWEALQTIAVPAFESADVVTYHGIVQFESWDAYADQYAGKSFNSLYTAADVRRPEVEDAFHRLGGPEHRFESPKNVMFLKGRKKDCRPTPA